MAEPPEVGKSRVVGGWGGKDCWIYCMNERVRGTVYDVSTNFRLAQGKMSEKIPRQ